VIALRALSFVAGLAIATGVLGSAIKTVVLPQSEGSPRLVQFVFAAVYRLLVRRRLGSRTGGQMAKMYAPVALVTLPLAWMILMAVGFTFIFWGTGNVVWQKAFAFSGSSLTTLGFSEPDTTSRIWLAFIEATIGLGLVALLISYLPTIFTSYNGRERGVVRLRPLAGSPPSAVATLQTLQRMGAISDPDFWRNQSDWLLDLEQSHTSFPMLCYFPETHQGHSWVATAGTILDAANLLVSASQQSDGEHFADIEKGPLIVLVYGMPAFVNVARGAGVRLPEPTRLEELRPHMRGPAPPISIGRSEFEDALAELRPIVGTAISAEDAWNYFAWTRSVYEPALRALAGLTKAPPAPWTTDRPAVVGRPPFLHRRPLKVDFSVALAPSESVTPSEN
jgi:hypothetical protein